MCLLACFVVPCRLRFRRLRSAVFFGAVQAFMWRLAGRVLGSLLPLRRGWRRGGVVGIAEPIARAAVVIRRAILERGWLGRVGYRCVRNDRGGRQRRICQTAQGSDKVLTLVRLGAGPTAGRRRQLVLGIYRGGVVHGCRIQLSFTPPKQHPGQSNNLLKNIYRNRS